MELGKRTKKNNNTRKVCKGTEEERERSPFGYRTWNRPLESKRAYIRIAVGHERTEGLLAQPRASSISGNCMEVAWWLPPRSIHDCSLSGPQLEGRGSSASLSCSEDHETRIGTRSLRSTRTVRDSLGICSISVNQSHGNLPWLYSTPGLSSSLSPSERKSSAPLASFQTLLPAFSFSFFYVCTFKRDLLFSDTVPATFGAPGPHRYIRYAHKRVQYVYSSMLYFVRCRKTSSRPSPLSSALR